MDFYKWIWSHTIGRPYTYAIRDSYHEIPILWIIGLTVIGSTIGHYVGWISFLKFMGIFLLGVLIGHLFWGTKWIPDQGEKK
jgi:uncharacterized membrane protein AbrB (regulator of aidB expression)